VSITRIMAVFLKALNNFNIRIIAASETGVVIIEVGAKFTLEIAIFSVIDCDFLKWVNASGFTGVIQVVPVVSTRQLAISFHAINPLDIWKTACVATVSVPIIEFKIGTREIAIFQIITTVPFIKVSWTARFAGLIFIKIFVDSTRRFAISFKASIYFLIRIIALSHTSPIIIHKSIFWALPGTIC